MADVSVSTEHTLTPTQRRLNVGPPLASIHSTQSSISCCLGANDYTRHTHPTPAQCWPTVCNAGTTQSQQCITTHVHRRKLCGFKAAVSSAAQKNTGHSIPKLGRCRESGVNSAPTLNQHYVNIWVNSIFNNTPPILQRSKLLIFAHALTVTRVCVYSSKTR